MKTIRFMTYLLVQVSLPIIILGQSSEQQALKLCPQTLSSSEGMMELVFENIYRDNHNGLCETEGWKCLCDYIIRGNPDSFHPQMISYSWIDESDFEEKGDDCSVYRSLYNYEAPWADFQTILDPGCLTLNSHWFVFTNDTLALNVFFRDPLAFFSDEYIMEQSQAGYDILLKRAVKTVPNSDGVTCTVNDDPETSSNNALLADIQLELVPDQNGMAEDLIFLSLEDPSKDPVIVETVDINSGAFFLSSPELWVDANFEIMGTSGPVIFVSYDKSRGTETSATLLIHHNGTNPSPIAVNLFVGGGIELSPSKLTFDYQCLNVSSQQVVKAQNLGFIDVTITGILKAGLPEVDVSFENPVIPAGGSLDLTVTFEPINLLDYPKTSNLQVQHDLGSSAFEIELAASRRELITFEPAVLIPDALGFAEDRVFLGSGGSSNDAITIQRIEIEGPSFFVTDPDRWSQPNCLDLGTNVEYRYDASLSSDTSAVMKIYHDGINDSPVELKLSAFGSANIDWGTEPLRLEFRPENASALDTQTLQIFIFNPSNELIVSSLSTDGPFDLLDDFDFPIHLQPGESLGVRVGMRDFSAERGNLLITHNDPEFPNPFSIPMFVVRPLAIHSFEPGRKDYLEAETVTIKGSGFTGTSQVYLEKSGSDPLQLTKSFVDQQTLLVEVPADLDPGEFRVSVVDGDLSARASSTFDVFAYLRGAIVNEFFDFRLGISVQTPAPNASVKFFVRPSGSSSSTLLHERFTDELGNFEFGSTSFSVLSEYSLEATLTSSSDQLTVLYPAQLMEERVHLIPLTLKQQIAAATIDLEDLEVPQSFFGGAISIDIPVEGYLIDSHLGDLFDITEIRVSDPTNYFELWRRAAIALPLVEEYFDEAALFTGRFWLDLYEVIKVIQTWLLVEQNVQKQLEAINSAGNDTEALLALTKNQFLRKSGQAFWDVFTQVIFKPYLSAKNKSRNERRLAQALTTINYALYKSIFSTRKVQDFTANLSAPIIAHELTQRFYIDYASQYLVDDLYEEIADVERADGLLPISGTAVGSHDYTSLLYESTRLENTQILESIIIDRERALYVKRASELTQNLALIAAASTRLELAAAMHKLAKVIRGLNSLQYAAITYESGNRIVTMADKLEESFHTINPNLATPRKVVDPYRQTDVGRLEAVLAHAWEIYQGDLAAVSQAIENKVTDKELLDVFQKAKSSLVNEYWPAQYQSQNLLHAANAETDLGSQYDLINNLETDLRTIDYQMDLSLMTILLDPLEQLYPSTLLQSIDSVIQLGNLYQETFAGLSSGIVGLATDPLVSVSKIDYPEGLVEDAVIVRLKITNHGSSASGPFTLNLQHTENLSSDRSQISIADLGPLKSASLNLAYVITDRTSDPVIHIEFDGTRAFHRTISLPINIDQEATSIYTQQLSDEVITVFPNPLSNQKLTIESYEGVLIKHIEVLNTVGQSVANKQVSKHTTSSIELPHLTNGLYYLIIKTNLGIRQQPVLISR